MKLIAVAAVASMLAMGSPAVAERISFKGVCAITTGSIGGKNFATLKCSKKSEPGHYYIRSTKWEWKEKEEYRDLAKHAGRRFTCTFTHGAMVFLPEAANGLEMTDCR